MQKVFKLNIGSWISNSSGYFKDDNSKLKVPQKKRFLKYNIKILGSML